MVSVKPLVNSAYTHNGNEYKESNIGKYSAAATVGSGATIIAMKNIPFSGIKKPFENFKNIDFAQIKNVQIKKPNMKNIWQNMVSRIENLGTQANDAFTKLKSFEFKNLFKKPEFITNFMAKIKKPELLEIKIMEKLSSPKAAKYAQYAGFVAGAVVTGLAIDFLYNKISAYRADKK